MDTKKTPKADLEKIKGLFAELGLVAVLFLLLGAFNWRSYSRHEVEFKSRTADEVTIETVILTAENEPPPPPPEPEIQISQDLVNIKDNNEKIENEAIANAEDDQSRGQKAFIPLPDYPQPEEEEVDSNGVFDFVEDYPEFPGGTDKLYEFLGENVKYPSYAKEANIQGTVFVSFVVERDGSISNVKVLRDIGGGCGAEAVRVIKEMPKWEPGKQRGKPVRVSYNVPVRFGLK